MSGVVDVYLYRSPGFQTGAGIDSGAEDDCAFLAGADITYGHDLMMSIPTQ